MDQTKISPSMPSFEDPNITAIDELSTVTPAWNQEDMQLIFRGRANVIRCSAPRPSENFLGKQDSFGLGSNAIWTPSAFGRFSAKMEN